MNVRRAVSVMAVAGLAWSGAPAALANHLIPEETGAATDIGEGEDARGRPFPEPVLPCDGAIASVSTENVVAAGPATVPVAARACAGPGGGGVDVAVGREQPGADDPDGEGVGRVAASADADDGRVEIFFEDYTPGNVVANAVWEANDHSGCRLLPAHCGEAGVDDHDDDALAFRPLDQAGGGPGGSGGPERPGGGN